MVLSERKSQGAKALVHPQWWGVDVREASGAWQMLHWEEAVRCREVSAMDGEIEAAVSEGWPDGAGDLARAAAWVSEAVWPRGSAGLPLSTDEVRRARQIGTALLGPAPAELPVKGFDGAIWEIAAFFTPRERALIRLQVPPVVGSSPMTFERLNAAPAIKMQRLIAFARASMQSSAGASHG